MRSPFCAPVVGFSASRSCCSVLTLKSVAQAGVDRQVPTSSAAVSARRRFCTAAAASECAASHRRAASRAARACRPCKHMIPPSATGMTRPELFTLTPAAFFRHLPCGWNHAGSISARAAAADCPRAVPFEPLRERSSRLRRTCRVSRAQHNAPRRCSFAMDVARGAADPGPFHTPPARRSRFCSASQRNQVYADCVNLSALLRCARDTSADCLTTCSGWSRCRHRSRSDGELAVELAEQGNAVGEAKLRAGRHQCGILRRCGAVDDEARARKRLEHRREGRVADPVVRPGETRAQREHGIGLDRHQLVEARAELAPGVGAGAPVLGECEAAAVDVGFAVGRRAEALRLHRGVGRQPAGVAKR